MLILNQIFSRSLNLVITFVCWKNDWRLKLVTWTKIELGYFLVYFHRQWDQRRSKTGTISFQLMVVVIKKVVWWWSSSQKKLPKVVVFKRPCGPIWCRLRLIFKEQGHQRSKVLGGQCVLSANGRLSANRACNE